MIRPPDQLDRWATWHGNAHLTSVLDGDSFPALTEFALGTHPNLVNGIASSPLLQLPPA